MWNSSLELLKISLQIANPLYLGAKNYKELAEAIAATSQKPPHDFPRSDAYEAQNCRVWTSYVQPKWLTEPKNMSLS